jgi:hypothetical protein
MSAGTTLAILHSQRFRYSSPLLFNDPFDVQTELHFDFDVKSFPELVFREIEKVILGQRQVNLNQRNGWEEAIALSKSRAERYGYNRDYTKSIFDPLIRAMTQVMDTTRSSYNAHWRDMLARMRVFCVSEVNDNVLMWAHYADSHEGVVLKLRVLPSLDNHLCAAGPVIYRKVPPTFLTAHEWIDAIIGTKKIDDTKLYREYAYTKSHSWRYEREWRVWDLVPERRDELYSDYKFYPEEIEAVYFGCRMASENKRIITHLARSVNPHVSFFQASKSAIRYGLTFERA